MNNALSHLTKTKYKTIGGWIAQIVSIFFCVLFLIFFIVNATLLISSFVYPDKPPHFVGYTPLVVESNSMSPFFHQNDLMLIHNKEEDVVYESGTVVCFRQGDMYISHRIVKTDIDEDGNTIYITQGDANNSPDSQPVYLEQILGSYVTHFKDVGGWVLYMQTPNGMIYGAFLPIFALICLFWLLPEIVVYYAGRKNEHN